MLKDLYCFVKQVGSAIFVSAANLCRVVRYEFRVLLNKIKFDTERVSADWGETS